MQLLALKGQPVDSDYKAYRLAHKLKDRKGDIIDG